MIVVLADGRIADAGLSATARRHPMATLDGIVALDQLIQASKRWDAATKVQRDLLVSCRARVLGLLAFGEGHPVEPPPLPDVAPRTLASLVRKELATADGRLTGWGAKCAVEFPLKPARGTVTAETNAGAA